MKSQSRACKATEDNAYIRQAELVADSNQRVLWQQDLKFLAVHGKSETKCFGQVRHFGELFLVVLNDICSIKLIKVPR